MGYRDQVWRISPPHLEADGWAYLLTGRAGARRVGPFRSERAALDHQHRAFQRWRCRARQLGGWAWRRTAAEWCVTVPEGVDVGGYPLGPSPVRRRTT